MVVVVVEGGGATGCNAGQVLEAPHTHTHTHTPLKEQRQCRGVGGGAVGRGRGVVAAACGRRAPSARRHPGKRVLCFVLCAVLSYEAVLGS